MPFGTCVIVNESSFTQMTPKLVKIEGVQRSMLTNFEITQSFIHQEPTPKEVKYLFATDLKICIYDLTFVVGTEVIKPELKSKEEAKETYDQAVQSGHTAIYGSRIGNGLTEFKLGNVEPNVECKVIIKVAFNAQLLEDKQFFIKFPLDVYTPSGSVGCLGDNADEFHFALHGEKDLLENITSNIQNGHTDLNTMTFSIDGKVENQSNEKSIIVTFTNKEPIQSRCLTTANGSYSSCALILSPHLPINQEKSKEFVFLVDCSGSMSGASIRNAGECLEYFVKSLPIDSYFNIIRFGSNHKALFPTSQPYTKENADQAIKLAQNIRADLGATDIFSPLQSIFNTENAYGQRQIFILTDGEVDNPSSVIRIVSEHSNNNRCFSIGLGRGCDAGLLEGIANSSGGKCDFVQSGSIISEKVIPQLQSSLRPSLASIGIHIEGDDSFEVSPYPIPSINPNGSIPLFIRTKKDQSTFDNGLLVTGDYGQEKIEIPINVIEPLIIEENDQYGCSGGRNICSCILPLFAFSILQSLELKNHISPDEVKKAIELSISSGVLCQYTGYVGMSKCKAAINRFLDSECEFCCCYDCGSDNASGDCGMSGGMSGDENDLDVDLNYSFGCANPIDLCLCCSTRPMRRCYDSSDDSSDDDWNDECQAVPMASHSTTTVSNENLSVSLMRNQNIDGSWDKLSFIHQITGTTLDNIDEITISDPIKKEQCIATILAIAALRVKAADQKNSWALLESKALSWLHNVLPNTNIEAIINRIMPLI